MTFEINLKIEIDGIDSVYPEDLFSLCRATLKASEVIRGSNHEIFVGPIGVKE